MERELALTTAVDSAAVAVGALLSTACRRAPGILLVAASVFLELALVLVALLDGLAWATG